MPRVIEQATQRALKKSRLRRRCPFCGRPATHVAKWPWGSVEDSTGQVVDVRQRYCALDAQRVVAYQRSIGCDVRAYRYRRIH